MHSRKTGIIRRIFTPTVFWPMIDELYFSGMGKLVRTNAELIHLVHRWMVWDSFRVILIAIGFVASVRAISVPFPRSKS